MADSNVKLVEDYIEEVINQKRLDRLADFCWENAVLHAPPYVGLGVNFEALEDRLVLAHIAPHGPAHDHLHVGDELVRVRSENQTWETFDELRKGIWSCGLAGSEIVLTVRRHGSLITIPLQRRQIDQFDINLLEWFEKLLPSLLKHWADLRMEIQLIFGAGDLVTCYAINRGINLEYNRSAIWSEMDIFRLKDGRISEVWTVENMLDELTQLGYQVAEPVPEIA